MINKSNRGFAAMDSEKQRQIASKGGKAAHQEGKAHEFNADEAREAGRKGGKAAHAKGTAHEFSADEARTAGRKGGEAVSRNRTHMAEIGRKGGGARSAKRRSQQAQSQPLAELAAMPQREELVTPSGEASEIKEQP